MDGFSPSFVRLSRVVMSARAISFVGSAFSDFTVPLFIIQLGESPIHAALQWTILAVARFSSGYITPRLNFFKNDRRAIICLDVLQGLGILLPIALYNINPLLGCYLATLCNAIFSTSQQGFLNSFIVQVVNDEPNKEQARNFINASVENARQIGLMVGFGAAYFVAMGAGFKAAFIVDSVSFMFSALIFVSMGYFVPHIHNSLAHPPAIEKKSYSLLFFPQLKYLTVSQMVLSFALFLYNGAFAYHLKRNFNAPNIAVTMLFVFEYIGYFSGSYLAKQKVVLQKRHHIWFRLLLGLVFVGFAFAPNPSVFITMNFALSFIMGLTMPFIMSLFQKGVEPAYQRSMGAARTALVSIAGAVGAALSGVLMAYNYHAVFLLGCAACILSAAIFKIYVVTSE